MAGLPGVAAASSDSDRSAEKVLDIHKKAIIADSGSKDVHVVDVTNKEKRERKRFVAVVDNRADTASVSEVSKEKFQAMASLADEDRVTANEAVETTATDDGVQVSANGVTVQAKDIIERSDVYTDTNGSCNAYDYTHKWVGITAEFPNKVGDIGWGAISTALIALVGSSALSGGLTALISGAIALVGGLAAYVTNTYTLTFGAIEFDKSAFGYTQTLYGAQIGGGYHQSKGELQTVLPAPTHPNRLN